MFKKLSSSFLIVSACIFSSCTPTVKQEIAILPTPVSLTEQSGSFVLKDGMKIGVSDQSLFRLPGICRRFFGMSYRLLLKSLPIRVR